MCLLHSFVYWLSSQGPNEYALVFIYFSRWIFVWFSFFECVFLKLLKQWMTLRTGAWKYKQGVARAARHADIAWLFGGLRVVHVAALSCAVSEGQPQDAGLKRLPGCVKVYCGRGSLEARLIYLSGVYQSSSVFVEGTRGGFLMQSEFCRC